VSQSGEGKNNNGSWIIKPSFTLSSEEKNVIYSMGKNAYESAGFKIKSYTE
jgi:hypothetical protein